MDRTDEERLLDLFRMRGVLREADVRAEGIHPSALSRLVAKGEIERVGRGVYIASRMDPTEKLELAVAAVRVPKGVVCLISALSFHGLTNQLPRDVWIAVEEKPDIGDDEWPPMVFTRMSGDSYGEGRETHIVAPTQHLTGDPDISNGIEVNIYTPAKTIADCFKFRNKVGLDVAIEALRDGLRLRRTTRNEIWHYAKICRVQNVIRPYMEAIA